MPSEIHTLTTLNRKRFSDVHFLVSWPCFPINEWIDAAHGFTSWGTGPFSAYNEMADSRSWWSMMSLFNELSVSSEAEMDEEKTTSGEMEPLEQGVFSSAISGGGSFVLVSVAIVSMVSSLLS